MIQKKTKLYAFQSSVPSNKIEYAKLRKVRFEGSIDFEVEVLNEEDIEEYFPCHLIRGNGKWLLRIELEYCFFSIDESFFTDSIQLEVENLNAVNINSQIIYNRFKSEKISSAIASALDIIYQHQMDILG